MKEYYSRTTMTKREVKAGIERAVVTYQENEGKMTPLQMLIELHKELDL